MNDLQDMILYGHAVILHTGTLFDVIPQKPFPLLVFFFDLFQPFTSILYQLEHPASIVLLEVCFYSPWEAFTFFL